ncbi:Asp-tRNA(Asn)/Glu-tRNA(Gln) amidotransferase subunit GatB, partial [Campylobacter coli]|nr:Asp-tRNA(Asn)/Glu-tRNA(Gln) amidotransferase subunit GatB [Campylobacter coli]
MFEVVIGLEVHTQLNTKTKIFCSCATSFGEAPNTNVCPTCLALPGALPVLNEEAVKKAIAFGKAVNATINKKSIFNRKNYFYPDLPKAYQISQFDIPIVEKGELFININGENKRIGITRAHLEEDAGKNIHENNYSKVDLNRAGTPLLEIVSEPELRSSDEAVAYLKKLHSIIRFLDISDANMQEGSFRCDANVSIRPKGDTKLYTRVEIKNLNSFRFIQKAIEYEVKRQSEAWEDGTYEQEVVQETRLFDTTNLVTRSMRGKEEAAEYRYFPDPDLLPVLLKDEFLDTQIPELPDEKKMRYINELGIKESDAEVLIGSLELSRFFESLIALNLNPKL